MRKHGRDVVHYESVEVPRGAERRPRGGSGPHAVCPVPRLRGTQAGRDAHEMLVQRRLYHGDGDGGFRLFSALPYGEAPIIIRDPFPGRGVNVLACSE